MSAYLTREQLELVGEDGTTITVEAGDYLEGVEPWGLSPRDRTRWCDVLRLGLERDPPRRRREGEIDAHPIVILDAGGRMVYAHADDLLTVDDDFDP